MKNEMYEAPKAVVVDFENDYVAAAPSIGTDTPMSSADE